MHSFFIVQILLLLQIVGLVIGEHFRQHTYIPEPEQSKNAQKSRYKRETVSPKIDTALLDEYSGKYDPVTFFKKFIGNVKVKEEGGKAYLVDLHGKPLLGEDNRKVYISPSEDDDYSPTVHRRGGLGRQADKKYPVITHAGACKIRTLPSAVPYTNRKTDHYYYPPCVEIPSCTGCCGQDNFACEATKQYEIIVQTYQFKIVTEGQATPDVHHFDYNKVVNVTMMGDAECKCGCLTKQTDCTPRQSYNFPECRCYCANQDDEDKCGAKPQNDYLNWISWNRNTCTCDCRHEICPAGQYFDSYSCYCDVLHSGRNFRPPRSAASNMSYLDSNEFEMIS